MEATEKTRQIHEAYLNCKEIFEPDLELLDEVFRIEDEEERMFYNTLCQFFPEKGKRLWLKTGFFDEEAIYHFCRGEWSGKVHFLPKLSYWGSTKEDQLR